jgi:hypothetical protein
MLLVLKLLFLGVSEEFPLFLPRQGGRRSSGDDLSELSKSVGTTLGFSSMESPRIDTVESTASLVNYGTSSGTRESYPDVQKGIKLLRRSVGCLCAYGFGQLSLSVPSDMSILDAFAELLNILSSKETRSRLVLPSELLERFSCHTASTIGRVTESPSGSLPEPPNL